MSSKDNECVNQHSPDKTLNNHNFRGETSLQLSVRAGQLETCKRLIYDGADVNAVDNAGWTPLHEACTNGFYDLTDYLIKSGADVNKISVDGVCPLHVAVQSQNCELIWLLLRNGADKHKRSLRGELPIDLNINKIAEIDDLLTKPTIPEQFSSTTNIKQSTVNVNNSDDVELMSHEIESNHEAKKHIRNCAKNCDSVSDVYEFRSSPDSIESSLEKYKGNICNSTNEEAKKEAGDVSPSINSKQSTLTTNFNTNNPGDGISTLATGNSSIKIGNIPKRIKTATLAKELLAAAAASNGTIAEIVTAKQEDTIAQTTEAENNTEESSNFEMDVAEENDKKVPPLRILLPKTSSCDEGNEINDKIPIIVSPILIATNSSSSVLESCCDDSKKDCQAKGTENEIQQRITRSRMRQAETTTDGKIFAKRKVKQLRHGSNKNDVCNELNTDNNIKNDEPATSGDFPDIHEKRNKIDTSESTTLIEIDEDNSRQSGTDENNEKQTTNDDEADDEENGINDADEIAQKELEASPFYFGSSLDASLRFNEAINSRLKRDFIQVLHENTLTNELQSSIIKMYNINEQLRKSAYQRLNDEIEVEVIPNITLPLQLQKLYAEQVKSRNEMRLRFMRERCEKRDMGIRAYLRACGNRSNLTSAVRILWDTSLFDPHAFCDENRNINTSTNDIAQTATINRLKNLLRITKNRQNMEAQALFINQEAEWKKMLAKLVRQQHEQQFENESINLHNEHNIGIINTLVRRVTVEEEQLPITADNMIY